MIAQRIPAAATVEDLYEVPTAKLVTWSTLVITNQNAAPSTVRVAVAIGGAADAASQYFIQDMLVPGKDSGPYAATFGDELAEGDIVRVWAEHANVAFHLMGRVDDV
jgi:hypothetical protein